jgi:hypothetical protein
VFPFRGSVKCYRLPSLRLGFPRQDVLLMAAGRAYAFLTYGTYSPYANK